MKDIVGFYSLAEQRRKGFLKCPAASAPDGNCKNRSGFPRKLTYYPLFIVIVPGPYRNPIVLAKNRKTADKNYKWHPLTHPEGFSVPLTVPSCK